MARRKNYVGIGMLKDMDACPAQQGLFRSVFPYGAKITVDNIVKALTDSLDVRWFLYHSVDTDIFRNVSVRLADLGFYYLKGSLSISDYRYRVALQVYDALETQIREHDELARETGLF